MKKLLLANISKVELQPVLHIDEAFQGYKEALDTLLKLVTDPDSEERVDITFFDVDAELADMRIKALGCRSCCPFCGRKCELEAGHSTLTIKHNCDNVGHQLRIYKGGTWSNKDGDQYPSMSTCDMLRQDKPVNLDGVRMLWADILKSQLQPVNWEINYAGFGTQRSRYLKEMKREQENTWARVGKKFLERPGAPKDVIFCAGNIEDQKPSDSKILIVIILDESTSMKGEKWENACNGIKHLK